MTMTVQQARDEIMALFSAAWPDEYKVLWQDKGGRPPDEQAPWARFTISHTAGGQATLSNDNGRKRFRRDGFLIVQIFTPVGDGLSSSDTLTKIVLDAYEGKATPGGAWFRNVRVNEVGPDGDWYQVNVLADFTYDEVK